MAAHHRVTEVGIVLLDGGEVVEEWSSLVNPGVRIPPAIQRFTGINNEMVADAPPFEDLRRELRARLDGRLFVAHNARFDYGFLRNEFRRLGREFTAPVLCTVRLSRALFREHARHNLDALIERYGLECAQRHRALGDAAVLPALLAAFEGARGRGAARGGGRRRTRASRDCRRTCPRISPTTCPRAPASTCSAARAARCSTSARAATCAAACSSTSRPSIARARRRSSRSRCASVEWIETGGELGALLLESRLVKDLAPSANRRLRKPAGRALRAARARRMAGSRSAVEPLEAPATSSDEAEAYGPFRTERDARRALEGKAREAGLCLKVMGLERGEGSCFALQLGRCRGACVGSEPRALHDARLRLALVSLRMKPWPFAGPSASASAARRARAACCTSSTAGSTSAPPRDETEVAALLERARGRPFDPDGYRIVARCLERTAPRDLVMLGGRRSADPVTGEHARRTRVLRRLPAPRAGPAGGASCARSAST